MSPSKETTYVCEAEIGHLFSPGAFVLSWKAMLVGRELKRKVGDGTNNFRISDFHFVSILFLGPSQQC